VPVSQGVVGVGDWRDHLDLERKKQNTGLKERICDLLESEKPSKETRALGKRDNHKVPSWFGRGLCRSRRRFTG